MPNKVWEYPLKNYSDRAKIVREILNLNIEDFDVSDAIYFTKMLLENGKVYISEEAFKQISYLKDEKLSKTRIEVFNTIIDSFEKQGVYMQTDNYIQSWINRRIFTWEHVVPVSIIGTKMKEDSNLIEKYFKGTDPLIDKIGHVCIVTKQEDKLLNKAYKNKMPDGLEKKPIEDWTEEDVWARYTRKGIKIRRINTLPEVDV